MNFFGDCTVGMFSVSDWWDIKTIVDKKIRFLSEKRIFRLKNKNISGLVQNKRSEREKRKLFWLVVELSFQETAVEELVFKVLVHGPILQVLILVPLLSVLWTRSRRRPVSHFKKAHKALMEWEKSFCLKKLMVPAEAIQKLKWNHDQVKQKGVKDPFCTCLVGSREKVQLFEIGSNNEISMDIKINTFNSLREE